MNWLISIEFFAVVVLLLDIAYELRRIRRRQNEDKDVAPVLFREIGTQELFLNQVELLRKSKGDWAHHSFRPAGHRDIEEALATPGLAIRQDGVTTLGVQDAL